VAGEYKFLRVPNNLHFLRIHHAWPTTLGLRVGPLSKSSGSCS